MKIKSTKFPGRLAGRRHAFTLIEMVGVLAVLAVLAAVLLPALIKETDKVVADQESAALKTFGKALQNCILRYRRIPADGTGPDWATNIAAEAGLNLAGVTANARQQPRVFLIDTNGFGALTLPYAQTSSGTPNPLTNSTPPRFMLVSSLGRALPTLNSRLATTDFNNLWNSTPTAFPTTGAWAGWTGDPRDVIVQRINLSPLFVNLLLTTNNSTANYGSYSIDSGTTNTINTSGGLNAYFLQSSILTLYSNSVPDSQQILQNNISFVYDQNVWRSSITSISVNNTNPPDYSGMVNAFANSALPAGVSTTNTPNAVTTDFVNYMNAYTNWAGAGFPSGALKNAAISSYNVMMTDVNGLVNAVNPH